MATRPDHEYMLAVKQGDLDQMEVLYQRYRNPLMGFFFRLTGGDREQSEDLVQSVFLRALKYRHSYREGAALKPWLFQMARNVFYDVADKQQPWKHRDDIGDHQDKLPQAAHLNSDHMLEQQEQRSFLSQALRRMPRESQELIELCKYQEMPYRQVAELLGTTEGNIKVKLHRAIKQLGAIYHNLTLDAQGYE